MPKNHFWFGKDRGWQKNSTVKPLAMFDNGRVLPPDSRRSPDAKYRGSILSRDSRSADFTDLKNPESSLQALVEVIW
jgi:hypothetical protein